MHHVISVGDCSESLFYSIDFEIVELRFPKELRNQNGWGNLEFWNKLIEISCVELKKEHRRVFSIKSGDRLRRFSSCVFEYVGESDNGTWTYAMETRTHLWPNFYDIDLLLESNRRQVVCVGTEKQIARKSFGVYEDAERPKMSTVEREISSHSLNVLSLAARQGLTSRHAIHEPDNKVFENFFSLLNDKINGNSNGAS